MSPIAPIKTSSRPFSFFFFLCHLGKQVCHLPVKVRAWKDSSTLIWEDLQESEAGLDLCKSETNVMAGNRLPGSPLPYPPSRTDRVTLRLQFSRRVLIFYGTYKRISNHFYRQVLGLFFFCFSYSRSNFQLKMF